MLLISFLMNVLLLSHIRTYNAIAIAYCFFLFKKINHCSTKQKQDTLSSFHFVGAAPSNRLHYWFKPLSSASYFTQLSVKSLSPSDVAEMSSSSMLLLIAYLFLL